VVRLGDEIIAEVTANAWRPDLVAAGIGDGYHAFNLMFGRMLSETELAAVTVEVSGGAYVIPIAHNAIQLDAPLAEKTATGSMATLITSAETGRWVGME